MSKQACKRLRRMLELPVNRKPLPNNSEGYPLVYYTTGGDVLCAECVNDNIESVEQDTRERLNYGWALSVCDVHYEGEPEICGHCGKAVESAYGVPDEAN